MDNAGVKMILQLAFGIDVLLFSRWGSDKQPMIGRALGIVTRRYAFCIVFVCSEIENVNEKINNGRKN
jgi:hypothetical protein